MDNQFFSIFAYVICVIGLVITFSAKLFVKAPGTDSVVSVDDGDLEEETIRRLDEIERENSLATKRLLTIKSFGLWILIAGVILLFLVNR